MERQIEQLLAHGRLGTARNYRRTRQSFSQFLHGEDLSFAGCTAELVADYEQWLKRRGVTRNTVSFYMRILRSVYNKAVGEGIASQRAPFEKVYTGVDKTRKRAVDMATIESLRKLDLRGSRSLAYARDLFVFSFYMRGMAFVDMAYLRKSDVRDQTAQYIRRKTGQSLCIRLEPCITEIIRRYARKTKNSPYVFPIIAATDENEAYAQYQNALSYYNKLLKKLNDEYTALLDKETRSRDFRAAMGEDVESVRPVYDYAETQIRLAELEAKIRKLKHAINIFNATQTVDSFDMTIDELLVYIPQLTKRKSKLLEMKSRLPKERVEEQYGRQSSIIDYTYANYDIAEDRPCDTLPMNCPVPSLRWTR